MKIFKWLFLALLLSQFFQIGAKAQQLSPEQLQSDFALVKTALEEVHPEMYRYTAKETFDSLFAATRARLNQPMSQHQFYTTLVPILKALRDGHMKWIVSGRDFHYPFFEEQLFPLKLYFVDKQAWIIENYGEEQLPLGAELLAINQLPIAQIADSLLANMFFADGYTRNGNYHNLNHFFSGYYATYFGGSNPFEIRYKQGGKEEVAVLKAVSRKTIDERAEKTTPAHPQPWKLSFLNEETACITLTVFGGEKKAYKAFLKQTFGQLEDKQVQHLLIDLRNNEGGNEAYGLWLYRYLAKEAFRYYAYVRVNPTKELSFQAWTPKHMKLLRRLLVRKTAQGHTITKLLPGTKEEKPERNAFRGDVYVLVNGSSFSVTSEFSARVHADNRATFVGQETGGGYEGNSSGIFTIVPLPNAKIDLGIPMMGFHMANLPAGLKEGQGIIPHHVVVPTAADILQKRDVALEHTLQLIQEKAQSGAVLNP